VGGSVTVTASGRLELSGTGLLAGSGASLADCLRWATRETGIPSREVLAMCTEVPARIAGLEGRGSLRVGATADLVVVDEDDRVQRVIAAGAEVRARRG
jgi:N-acetylglucosamine-6-phosphate deacetylase